MTLSDILSILLTIAIVLTLAMNRGGDVWMMDVGEIEKGKR